MKKQIILTPKTRKGKNIILRDGNEFVLLEIRENVPCLRGGTGLFILPPNKNFRWVNKKDDENFNWRIKNE